MTINAKISSDRKLDIKNRRFGGIQGDIGSVDIDFDISDVASQNQSWRVEFKGCAGTFESTVPLTPENNHISVTIPKSICDVGGTAQVYLIEELITDNEVKKRVCSYPLRLYFYNKPNKKVDGSVSEYERDVMDMYLYVANKASEIEESIKNINSLQADINKRAYKLQGSQTIDVQEQDVNGTTKTIVQLSGECENRINNKADKSYVDSLMSSAVKRLVVTELPSENIDGNTIYMILRTKAEENNIYDEYMYINSAWEKIGSTDVDLSGYATKAEVADKFDSVDTSINSLFQQATDLYDAKQDKLTAGNGITISNDNTISVPIDTALSSTSENPVQNKVINEKLNEKFSNQNFSEFYTNAFTPLNQGFNSLKQSYEDLGASERLNNAETNIGALQGIVEEKQDKLTIDNNLSSTSTNPIQNKAVFDALNKKYEVIETVTTTEEISLFVRSAEPDGTTYKFDRLKVLIDVPVASAKSSLVVKIQKDAQHRWVFYYYNAEGITTSKRKYSFESYKSFGYYETTIMSTTGANDYALPAKYGQVPAFWGVDESQAENIGYLRIEGNLPIGTKITILGVRA